MTDRAPEPAAATSAPGHVAIIMDGNGRWAEQRGLPRTEGHRQGEERLAEIVRAADALGIGWLTVYGFSTENWKRPRMEVDFILGLHKNIFGRRDEMHANNVRIRWIGRAERPSRIPRVIRREIDKSVTLTKDNTGLNFTVAFDYGGREELVHAFRGALEEGGEAVPGSAAIERHLYEPALPRVDLLVRTSGEYRLSNFLLWQAAGSPFYVTPTFWPDFDQAALEAAVAWWRGVVPADPPGPGPRATGGDRS